MQNVQGIIEGIAVRRRKEETSRVHLTISFPAGSNMQLVASCILNQGNAVDFGVVILQGALLEDDDDDDGPPKPRTRPTSIFPEGMGGEGDPDTTGNDLADKLIGDSRIEVDPEEAAQAEAKLASASSGNGRRGKPIGLPAGE